MHSTLKLKQELQDDLGRKGGLGGVFSLQSGTQRDKKGVTALRTILKYRLIEVSRKELLHP